MLKLLFFDDSGGFLIDIIHVLFLITEYSYQIIVIFQLYLSQKDIIFRDGNIFFIKAFVLKQIERYIKGEAEK